MKKLSSLLMLVIISSCGTIFAGRTKSVNIIPSDSKFTSEVEVMDGGIVKTTKLPAFMIVSRSRQSLIINVKEDGCYKSSQSAFSSKLNLFTLLNVFGGLWSTSSTSTDGAAGALWSYDDNLIVNTTKKSDCKK